MASGREARSALPCSRVVIVLLVALATAGNLPMPCDACLGLTRLLARDQLMRILSMYPDLLNGQQMGGGGGIMGPYGQQGGTMGPQGNLMNPYGQQQGLNTPFGQQQQGLGGFGQQGIPGQNQLNRPNGMQGGMQGGLPSGFGQQGGMFNGQV